MQNVLITGVSGGIGFAVAQQLVAEGSSIIGVDLGLSEQILNLKAKYPEHVALLEYDLSHTNELPTLVKKLVREYGRIGGLVHCAGFDKMAPLHMAKERDYESLWRIHALVPMLLIGAISKRPNHTEETSVVLISSQSAHEGAQGHAAYASAKGAIEGFLAPAAAELMDKGIRLNEVCLAPVRTAMAESWMSRLTDEGKAKLLESYPLGLSEASDAAVLICFLLSSSARFINGQIITADGGHAVRKV